MQKSVIQSSENLESSSHRQRDLEPSCRPHMVPCDSDQLRLAESHRAMFDRGRIALPMEERSRPDLQVSHHQILVSYQYSHIKLDLIELTTNHLLALQVNNWIRSHRRILRLANAGPISLIDIVHKQGCKQSVRCHTLACNECEDKALKLHVG